MIVLERLLSNMAYAKPVALEDGVLGIRVVLSGGS